VGLASFSWWLLLNAAAALLAAGSLAFAWRRRPPAPLWPTAPLALVAIFLWAVGDLAAELSTSLVAYQVSLFVYYTGVIGTPAVSWRLALRFAEAQGMPFAWGRSRWAWAPVAAFGLLWLGMATNPWHHAFVTPVVDVLSPRNALWYANAASIYLTIGSVVVLYWLLRHRHRSWAVRRKAVMMAAAFSAPLVANFLYVSGLFEPPVDATFFGLFAATGLIMAGIYRTGLFNPLPVALPEVIENDPTGVVLLDANRHVIFANAAARKLFPDIPFGPEFEFASVLARHVRRADDPESPPNPVVLLQELDPANHLGGEGLYRFAEAPERWLRISCHAIHSRRGAELGKSLRLQDVTELRHASEGMRRSALRFRALAENSSDIVVEIRSDGRCAYVSPRVRQVLGREPGDLLGRSLASLCHPDERQRVERWQREVLEEGGLAGLTLRVSHADGSWRWLDVSAQSVRGAPATALIAIARDVTDRRALVHRFVAAQKLESLGVVAGGVAHDFNNLLVGVLGNAQLARQYAEDQPALHELLGEIEAAALRASDLTDQMLTYAGEGSFDRSRFRLSECVGEVRGLLEATAGGCARIEFELGSGPELEGDPARIRQVVVSLVTNAVEALEGRPGRIRVRTGRQEVDGGVRARAHPGAELEPGLHAFLEVADHGAGMDETTQARMFDPFFSTRFTGRGLGLAAVMGIVRAHRGAVLVESGVGRGTAVRVLLPPAGTGDAGA